MVTFRQPTDADLEFLADNLRLADQVETRCIFPTGDLRSILKWSVDNSVETLVATDGDEPIALFGVGLTEVGGVPWMCGTDKINQFKLKTLRSVKVVIEAWLNHYGYLYNDVHKDNLKAQAMVKRLGFTVDTEPSSFHPDFHRFWKTRGE